MFEANSGIENIWGQLPKPPHVLIDGTFLLDWTIAKHFHGDHIIICGGQDRALLQDGPIRTLDHVCSVAQKQESVHTHHTHTIPLIKNCVNSSLLHSIATSVCVSIVMAVCVLVLLWERVCVCEREWVCIVAVCSLSVQYSTWLFLFLSIIMEVGCV